MRWLQRAIVRLYERHNPQPDALPPAEARIIGQQRLAVEERQSERAQRITQEATESRRQNHYATALRIALGGRQR